MKNRTLILAAAFIFAITPMIAASPATNATPSTYSDSKSYFGVSEDQIYQYMLSYGYHVQTLTVMNEAGDVYATTLEKHSFIIHIQDSAIIGLEDMGY